MKIATYAVAVLAAVGIVVALSLAPVENAAPESAPVVSNVATSTPLTEAGEVTLDVPGMHCQFACFPRVKETLQKEAAVTEVALVDQPDPNTLTVKKVIVRYDEGFDVSEALENLHAVGFDATMVQ